MKKRILTLLIGLALLLSLSSAVYADEDRSTSLPVITAGSAAVLRTGDTLQANTGWVQENGSWYYYQNGSRYQGWLKYKDHWYYLNPQMLSGNIYRISSVSYYFDAKGIMASGGWTEAQGAYSDGSTWTAWCYADSSGKLATGWKKIRSTWYYFDEWGRMYENGVYTIGGSLYYFKESGAMASGGWASHVTANSSGTTETSWHYALSDGRLVTGWKKIGTKWYYFSTSGFMFPGGVYQIGSNLYHFDNNGALYTNGWSQRGSFWYYSDADGRLAKGWLKVKNSWYYFSKDNGTMQTGWLTLNDNVYFLSKSGAMATGWWTINDDYYYFSSSGVRQTGWIQTDKGVYYLNSSGIYRDTLPSDTVAYNRIMAQKPNYPEGMHWTNEDNVYVWDNTIYSTYSTYTGYGCVAFCMTMSDIAYGKLPVRRVDVIDYDSLHVGDILRINNDRHSVTVMEIYDDHVVIAEGNYNSSVHWGRTLTKSAVLQANYVFTRWPESVKRVS